MSSYIRCGICNEEVTTNMAFCWKCGAKVELPQQSTPSNIANTTLMLDCGACHTTSSMIATKVPRFSGIVRLIGVILLIPSFLGIFFALMMFASIFSATAGTSAHSEAEQAGKAIGFGIGFVVALVCGVVSLVGGLVGWLLLMTRGVWRCSRCGFVLDRA